MFSAEPFCFEDKSNLFRVQPHLKFTLIAFTWFLIPMICNTPNILPPWMMPAFCVICGRSPVATFPLHRLCQLLSCLVSHPIESHLSPCECFSPDPGTVSLIYTIHCISLQRTHYLPLIFELVCLHIFEGQRTTCVSQFFFHHTNPRYWPQVIRLGGITHFFTLSISFTKFSMARMIFNDDHVPCLTTYTPSRCSGSADQMRGKVLSVPTLMKNHLPCEVLLLKD